MITTSYRCHVCRATAVRPLASYAALPRVSSDCRPVPAGGELAVCDTCGAAQKPATLRFLDEIGSIYASYDIYHQGGGSEQIVFDAESGGAMRRSELLAARIHASTALPTAGRAIDIGCGNGAFLRALGNRFPAWDLFGLELDDRNLPAMRDIPRFTDLLQGDAKVLEGIYTLVTLIHALEHFTDPFESLVALRRNVAADGLLFTQVPNLEANPFDLVIADHATHFTPAALEAILLHAGWEVVRLETGWVSKELSVLARPAAVAMAPCQTPAPYGLAAAHVDWLGTTLAGAEAAAAAPVFGVFGTSIAGTWLAGALADRIAFYVDEDPSRVGQRFLGKPVIGPDRVPDGAVVFLGLSPLLAKTIGSRIERPGITLVSPPPLAA